MVSADKKHHAWMGLALAEARRALDTEDVPIGAVVIGPDGSVLGSGRNQREELGDPTAHAEVVAIREAAERLRQVSLLDGGALPGAKVAFPADDDPANPALLAQALRRWLEDAATRDAWRARALEARGVLPGWEQPAAHVLAAIRG